MNDDLILRARLHAQGYSDEDILKIGVFGGAGQASGKWTDRLPGGAKRQDKRMGQDGFTANNQAVMTGQDQVSNQQAYADKKGAKGYETLTTMPTGMTEQSVKGVNVPGKGAPPGAANISPKGAMERGMTTGMPEPEAGGDGSVTGTAAIPDVVETKQKTELGPDGNATNTTTTVDENINSNETGDSGTTPATGMDATGATTPTTQDPQQATQQPAQQQQQGGAGVNAQVQGMAQQFQAGQDMEAIQQGKGADKKSWLKDRSLTGKIFDGLSFGATKGIGSTGSGARKKANAASAQQTQNFQGANQRMNQRAMGMNAQMPVQTSFDSQLSAYSDIISIRKGIQERNTTHNLRR